MNFSFKTKLQPLFEQDYQPGIRVCNYITPKENSVDLHIERPENDNNKKIQIKDKFSEYIRVIEEINKLDKQKELLEIKKQKIEKELLNNPISKQVIDELNNSKINSDEILKKLTNNS